MSYEGDTDSALNLVLRLSQRLQVNSQSFWHVVQRQEASLTSGQALDGESLVSEESHVFCRHGNFVCLVMGSELSRGMKTASSSAQTVPVHLQGAVHGAEGTSNCVS